VQDRPHGCPQGLVNEAERRARRQAAEAIEGLRHARLAAGIRQAAVARALGVSRQLISTWELGRLHPDLIQLARWGAIPGRDVRLSVYAAGSPLRDAAHISLIARARTTITGPWTWHTEVPVTAEALDRRAFDVVLTGNGVRVGLELITRFVDAQAQIRQANVKLEAGGLDRIILALADTARNRETVRAAAPYVTDSYPRDSRTVLAALRAGQPPSANGLIFA
jgi:transcriptional regulator with XRE-family HTH domain